jgi:transporter family protein
MLSREVIVVVRFEVSGPASLVAPVDTLSVALVALFASTFLGERLLPKNWLGNALIGLRYYFVARR